MVRALSITGAAGCGAYGLWLAATGGAGLFGVAAVGLACAVTWEVATWVGR